MALGAFFRPRARRPVHQSVHRTHRSVADRDGQQERTGPQRPHASRTVRRRRGRNGTLPVRSFGKRNAAHAHAARAPRIHPAGPSPHASSGATSAPGRVASYPRTAAPAASSCAPRAPSPACSARTSATRSDTASSDDTRSRAPAAHDDGAAARRSAAWSRRRRAAPGTAAAGSAAARHTVACSSAAQSPPRKRSIARRSALVGLPAPRARKPTRSSRGGGGGEWSS
jgi:hypothetical protein